MVGDTWIAQRELAHWRNVTTVGSVVRMICCAESDRRQPCLPPCALTRGVARPVRWPPHHRRDPPSSRCVVQPDGRSATVPPPDVVRHDGDDSYLVVAADKGTAKFSDIANEVAASYGFWLGDAFASIFPR